MARAIWSGVLSFGLVAVPVELYSATETHRPAFHQFEEGTADRIRYQRVNERTGDEVKYSDIVKGADVDGGDYVMLNQDELDSVAPGRSRSLNIDTFVELDEIDAIYFDKTYFLGPGNGQAAKPYALLRDAMGEAGKAAIANFVLRGREYLAAVRADDDLLVLETLFFADEVRDPHAEISGLPGRVKLSRQETRMARQLVDSMSGPWTPSDYRDTYTDRVNELIEAKKSENEVEPAAGPPAATNVTDLTAALRASVDAAKKAPRGKRDGRSKPDRAASASKPGAKSTGAKKKSGKKSPAKDTAARQRRGKRAA
ncbi:MAG TPA: Ku protein [Trebonia sp.]|jgi:DNA end-binding protein Ku